MIKGSYCPHYDAEVQRRPIFHAALLDGSLEMGYASWNRVAIRFTPAGEVVEAVTGNLADARSRSTPWTARSSRRTSPAGSSRNASSVVRCPPDSRGCRAGRSDGQLAGQVLLHQSAHILRTVPVREDHEFGERGLEGHVAS